MSKYIRSQKYFVIPTFIELLDDENTYTQERVLDALLKVSSGSWMKVSSFGYDTGKWNNWWRINHSGI